jgi:hypothetical protein
MGSGTHNSIVGRLANSKIYASQCPKRSKFIFDIADVFNSFYELINRETGRAFVKFDNFIR